MCKVRINMILTLEWEAPPPCEMVPTQAPMKSCGFLFLDWRSPPPVINCVVSPCTRLNQLQFGQLTGRIWMMRKALTLLYFLSPEWERKMSAEIKNLGNTQAKTACSLDYKDYKCVRQDPKISGLVLCEHTRSLLPF